MGTSLQVLSMISRWTGLLTFLVVLHLVCSEEQQKEEHEKPQEETEAKQPWLGSLLGLTRRDVRADKDDMFWATRGKRTADDFWAIRGKKEYIKPNGFFQPLSTQKPGKRSFKPNGLFSTMKRSSLKPNSLFTAFKRGGFKPNRLFGTYKRSSLKPNGLFGSYKRYALKPNGLFGAYKRNSVENDPVKVIKEHLAPIEFGWDDIEDNDEKLIEDEYQEYLDEHYYDDEYDNEQDFDENHAAKREDPEFWAARGKKEDPAFWAARG